MLNHSSEFGDLLADSLSEVLQDLSISGVSYGRCELTSPWGISFPPQNAARLHFVARGTCWMHTPELGWTPLRAGDVALLPLGTGHTLADIPGGPTQPLDAFPLDELSATTYRLRAGGGGAEVLLLCCSVSFESPEIHPLLELMLQALLVCGAASDDTTLPMILDIMANEVVAQRVGAATVMTRLADVVVTRVYFDGLWEDTLGVNARKLYTFNGAVVAQPDSAGAVTFLHGDKLGSISVTTDANGNRAGKQDFDPWGKVLPWHGAYCSISCDETS